MDAAASGPIGPALEDLPDEPEAAPGPATFRAAGRLDTAPVDGARASVELHELVAVGTDRRGGFRTVLACGRPPRDAAP